MQTIFLADIQVILLGNEASTPLVSANKVEWRSSKICIVISPEKNYKRQFSLKTHGWMCSGNHFRCRLANTSYTNPWYGIEDNRFFWGVSYAYIIRNEHG